MRTVIRLPVILFLLSIFSNSQAQKTYILIPKKSEKLDKATVKALPANLKALAAFYSAMGGTNCREQECALTTALGLGKQGSDAQKMMIQKYFPDDKVAKLVVSQDCYLPPSSSSSFSNFAALSFVVLGETIQVNYQLYVYDHGNMKIIKGPDIYSYKNQVFKNQKRVLYAWTDK